MTRCSKTPTTPRFSVAPAVTLACALFAAACAPEGAIGPGGAMVARDAGPPSAAANFSDWSAPVNVGAPVNAAGFAEVDPVLSKDGLTLYFSCLNCPGGLGGYDIWVAERPDEDSPWGVPRNLGPSINTALGETNPALSPDEHSLYFTSNRPGFGAADLYVARRHDKRDHFGWQSPENLGPGINSVADDRMSASPFEDEATGLEVLYFISNRAGGPGGDDIYVSTRGPDGAFGSVVLVAELSSASQDRAPDIGRRGGLEIFFSSDRPGTHGGLDIWRSTRESTSDAWSPPTNLGPLVNSAVPETSPALSADRTTLYFQSARPGGSGPCMTPPGSCVLDLWFTTREKRRGDM